MIEHVELELFRRFGPGKGVAVCLGNQLPGMDSGFQTTQEIFDSLGYSRLVTLDYNGAATLNCDLNYPTPPALADTADMLFDGGVCEHVANIGQAFINILTMAKVGCVIYQILPLNCYGANYYGIDPMFLRDFYTANGVEVLSLRVSAKSRLRVKAGWIIRQRFPRIKRLIYRMLHSRFKGLVDLVSENNPSSIQYFSADPVEFDRTVPLHACDQFVGRKVRNVDKITWPAQGNYPKQP